jgi:hypothetical protein
MTVIAYPDNFNKIINLVVRLNNSFRRLKHAQKKPGKKVRNPNHKKKKILTQWTSKRMARSKKKKKVNLRKKRKRNYKVILNTLTAENKDIIQETAIRN